MYYRRRRGRKWKSVNKYNLETVSIASEWKSSDTNTVRTEVVASTNTTTGVRKVANIKGDIVISASNGDVGQNAAILAAIIYLPEGFDKTTINLSLASAQAADKDRAAVDIYSPSQNIMWSGTVGVHDGHLKFRVPINRNLNAGDRVILAYRQLFWPTGNSLLQVNSVISYAICYR